MASSFREVILAEMLMLRAEAMVTSGDNGAKAREMEAERDGGQTRV